ncbi:MAG: 6-bladed beta-propeller [Chloroflexota bacterium]|nr:6-bladed beta-propeller [Chloroflexota bacterium]
MMLPIAVYTLVAAALLVGSSAGPTESAPASPAPTGVAVDTEGNVYVSDYALDRVVKFAPDGALLGQWGASGSTPGQFSAPFGIAVDERVVYVVDQLNNRIQKFAADGSVLAVWGSGGASAGELRTPFGVAVSGGRVYVADFGNDRVQVFGADGSLLGVIGSRGSGEGQFLRPTGVAIDREGTIYVADHFNDRVQKFSAEGHFEGQLGATAASLGAASPLGGTFTTGAATPPTTALAEAQLRRPEGIALDHDGNLWVADYGRDRVVKLASDGRLLLALGGRGSGPGEFLGPKGIAVDGLSGRVYVADTGNARVQRFAPDGTLEAAWPMPPVSVPFAAP